MSFDAMAWAAKVRLPTVPKVILMVLAARGDKREQCWPSLATLSDDTGLSERALRNGIAELVNAGLVSKRRRGCAGVVYTVIPVSKAAHQAGSNGSKPAPGAGLQSASNAGFRAKSESKPAPGAAKPARGAGNPVQEPIKEESGAAPPRRTPPTAEQLLYREGLPILAFLLESEPDKCRGFMGTLRQTIGDRNSARLLMVLQQAVQVAPALPRPWLIAACQDRARPEPARRPAQNGAVELRLQAREHAEAEGARLVSAWDALPDWRGGH